MEDHKSALIIDTKQDSRHLLALRLEGIGYKVLTAETKDQIDRHLLKEKIDLVITEWALPGIEGEDLIALLDPNQRTVFLFTDHILENKTDFLNQTGVKDCVLKRKRFQLLELIENINRSSLSSAALTSGLKRILLVEDSTAIRHFIKRVLETEIPGSVILEANNGEQAFNEALQGNIDFIITDLEMPGIDGKAFLKMVREEPLLKSKPVLVLTACSLRELKEAYKQDTLTSFLIKPASVSQIMQALSPLIGQQPLLEKA